MSGDNPCFDAFFARHLRAATPFLRQAEGAALSHAAFFERVARTAATLDAFGVRPGDRVAVQTAKSPEQLALYAACLTRGAIYVPLNTAYTPAEIDYFLTDAEPALAVVDPSAETALATRAASAGARLATLDGAGGGSFAEAVAASPASELRPAARAEDDVAVILYTSGTTGRSKGAMLTHRNLVSNARTLAACWRFTAEDRLLHALPTFHAHGLFVACNVTFVAGGSLIWLPSFDAATVIEALNGATAMMGVPTYYTRLLDHPRFTRASAEGVRVFISGSAPLLAETHRAFEERTGQRILERYGMTETGMNASHPYDGERRAGSVGPALPGVEIKITDPDAGSSLPVGDIGMVEVRGPNVFKGYWRMPEKTAAELRADGFFITGDLGMLSADGYLTIVGRGKDLIISGGLNVYPKEVESAIDAIDGVIESAVIGAPHPDFGEAVVAVVVRASGAALSEAGIVASLSTSLANFKRPKAVVFVDALPRNTMGKVQKAALRAEHAAMFAPPTDNDQA